MYLFNLILVVLFWVSASFSQVEISSKAMHDELKSFKERFDQDSQINYDNLYLIKLEQIGKLGMTNVPHVKLAAKYKKMLASLDRVKKYVTIYAGRYPGNSFLTKGEVERIAKKYSLVFGNVNDFKGNIPEQNINEMLKFNDELLSEDYSEWKGIKYFAMAPLDQFDMTDKIVDGIYIIKDDPIIFARVNGGYLLVTYWGDDTIKPMQEIEKFVQKTSKYLIEESVESITWFNNGTTTLDLTGGAWDAGSDTLDLSNITWSTTAIQVDSTFVVQ